MEETSQFVPNNYGIQNIYYGTVINVYYNEYRMCDSAYSTCRESTTVEDDEIFEEDAPQEGKTVDYDALVSKRCYKERMSFREARDVILASMGKQFDPQLKDSFLDCQDQLMDYYCSVDH